MLITGTEYKRLIKVEEKYWVLRDKCFGVINKLSQCRIEEMPDIALHIVVDLKASLDTVDDPK